MNGPERYTKNPVTIQAYWWNGDRQAASGIVDWVCGNGGSAAFSPGEPERMNEAGETLPATNPAIIIETLEGPMRAGADWWVIRGLEGEFYPCKGTVFEASYHKASEDEALQQLADGGGGKLEYLYEPEDLLAARRWAWEAARQRSKDLGNAVTDPELFDRTQAIADWVLRGNVPEKPAQQGEQVQVYLGDQKLPADAVRIAGSMFTGGKPPSTPR